MIEQNTYCATCRVCGGWIYLVLDDPDDEEMTQETAKDVARLIRDGFEITKITGAEARTMEMCPSECPGRESQKTRDKQLTLGGGS